MGHRRGWVIAFWIGVASSLAAALIVAVVSSDRIRVWEAGTPSVVVPPPSTAPPTSRFSPPLASTFIQTEPSLVMDTRKDVPPGAKPLRANETTTVHFGSLPVNAVAASVSFAVEAGGQGGGFRIWAADAVRPVGAQLLATANETLANTTVTRLSSTADVKVQSDGGGDIILNVIGYWVPTPSSRSGRFYPAAQRIFDSRESSPFEAQTSHLIPILGYGGIPNSGVSAVALVVFATNATAAGYATVWASGKPLPVMASLTYRPEQIGVASAIISPVGSDGAIQLYTFATADFAVNTIGWFTDSTADDAQTGLFVPMASRQFADTTQGIPQGRLGDADVMVLDAREAAELPAPASAALIEIEAINPSGAGYAEASAPSNQGVIGGSVEYEPAATAAGVTIVEFDDGTRMQVKTFSSSDFRLYMQGWFE